jgi:hypothetical protein
VKLSVNDENVVIGNKVGEIHGKYDIDIETLTGVKKDNGEKTYDYLKRTVSPIKAKVTDLESKIQSNDAKIAELEGKIKEGKGSEAIVQKLADLEQKNSELLNQYNTDKSNWEKSLETSNKEKTSLKLSFEFEKSLVGVEFSQTIPESLRNIAINAAKSKLQNDYTPDWVDGNLVFRDKDGKVVLNKDKQLEPFSAKDLLMNELKDIVADGTQSKGAGSKGGKGQGSNEFTITESTQVGADLEIRKYLLSKGMARGTAEFEAEHARIRKENKVSELKMQ